MTFLQAAVAAFPWSVRDLAEDAGRALLPFVSETYRVRSTEMIISGRRVNIPQRISFIGLDKDKLPVNDGMASAIQCLCTRSTDGYLRQAALRHVLGSKEPWTIPFVVLLAGEYVVEIIEDMVAVLETLDREAYANFVRENRPLMRRLRTRTTSYWNCYYRDDYPDRSTYPGWVFLNQLDVWAS